MNDDMVAQRLLRTQVVRLFIYDKKFINTDGEPFSYVRCICQREKGSGYDLFKTVDSLRVEMANRNFISATQLPANAYRIAPNMYVHTIPAKSALYNLTAIYKRKDHDYYFIHNCVFLNCDIPSRGEMYAVVNVAFQSNIKPIAAELWQIKHCLTDIWANVCTTVTPQHDLWIHLRKMKRKVFRGGHRSLEQVLDDGRPGNTYTRDKYY